MLHMTGSKSIASHASSRCYIRDYSVEKSPEQIRADELVREQNMTWKLMRDVLEQAARQQTRGSLPAVSPECEPRAPVGSNLAPPRLN
jgi:hypothetical protein